MVHDGKRCTNKALGAPRDRARGNDHESDDETGEPEDSSASAMKDFLHSYSTYPAGGGNKTSDLSFPDK